MVQNRVVNSAGGNRSSKPILSAMPRKWEGQTCFFLYFWTPGQYKKSMQGLECVGYH